MQITYNGCSIEKQKKGRNEYEKMTVRYSNQGQSRTQSIISFANPAIFAKIKDFENGDILDVNVEKNEAGYNTWTSVDKIGGGAVQSTPKTSGPSAGVSSGTTARTSTYETPEERAKKQVYIIKQSCLAQAVAFDKGNDVEQTLEVAQQFVDWVLEDDGLQTEQQTQE